MTKRRPLTERMKIAAGYLAGGMPVRTVAHRLHVGERSVFHWKKRKDFQQEIRRLQAENLSISTATNLALLPGAIETLQSIMYDQEQRASDRIAAARAIMSGAEAHAERNALEAQIVDLERQLMSTLSLNLPDPDDAEYQDDPEDEEIEINPRQLLDVTPEKTD